MILNYDAQQIGNPTIELRSSGAPGFEQCHSGQSASDDEPDGRDQRQLLPTCGRHAPRAGATFGEQTTAARPFIGKVHGAAIAAVDNFQRQHNTGAVSSDVDGRIRKTGSRAGEPDRTTCALIGDLVIENANVEERLILLAVGRVLVATDLDGCTSADLV